MTFMFWIVLDMTDSPFLVALVGFFGMIPLLLFGTIGGVLADRVDRRKLLIVPQVVNLVTALIMLTMLISGRVEFWHTYIVVLMSGLGWAVDMPSRRSIVHDIIGRGGVTNGMALDSVGMHGSRMMGPALAGVLIGVVGVDFGYSVIVALYILSIGFMLILESPRRSTPVSSTGIFRNLAAGFVYVSGNRVILATVIVTVLMNLLLFPYMQMVPVIAKETLKVGPELMGVLLGADGFGAIIGSISIATAGNTQHHGRIYLCGSLIGLVMVMLFAASQWFGVSLAILVLLGLGTAGFGTMQSTIVVIAASEDMRGRALGVISLAIGAGPLGALMIGGLAEISSPSTAILVFASIGLITVGATGFVMRELRGDSGLWTEEARSQASGNLRGQEQATTG